MGKKFMRFIDAAQRRIVVERPEARNAPGVTEVVFQIQGIEIALGETTQFTFYHDMADRGVRMGKTPGLSVWQRLRRQPALIGSMRLIDENRCDLELWDDSFMVLSFDRDADDVLLREMEIMMMSAGYHWHIEESQPN
ncbi:hypothetical protein [Acanthopleuribacter pedis]|uniref:Uncharacterized protein n=1 Tax=Acanthopleuribacter pedis TaxID=442870 RepID=A0A8J7Q638_9BACT|nr:hypothetical protein [Acanthopleuribacter pedis]MBO1318837.1 hypothetical protein [Acanthopleuribacter pedis]